MKYKKALLTIAGIAASVLFLVSVIPSTILANVGAGWNATSTTQGQILPTLINGVSQAIVVGTTSPSIIGNFNTILDASQFAGVDMGDKINHAYAACPSIGCRITVPSGVYTITTPIVFGTNGKVVNLYCPVGGLGHFAVVGTTLSYTPSTGTAITINTNNWSAGGIGIDNCNILGSNGTSARSTIGVRFGGTNGAFAGYLKGVTIQGFGTGVDYYQNTSFNLIDSSTINFNGVNIFEEAVSGANGENMRVINSTIADSNNQAGGSVARFCVHIRLSGNVQWQFTNNSFDDCEVYLDQFGGTANVNHFTNNHWEDPAADSILAYDDITTLSNVPATEVIMNGNDFMMDANTTGKASEFISGGADFISTGDTVDLNSNVTSAVTRFITNSNATAVDTISWTGLVNNGTGSSAGKAVTNVYGTIPYSPEGYGTGVGLSFQINPAIGTDVGTTTATDFQGIMYAPNFAGSDIGAQVNTAYAACPLQGCIIQLPRGNFFFSTKINFGTNGKRVLLEGAPGEGTSLFYTGTAGCAVTMNTGIQNIGINHTSGSGTYGIFLHGNSYSTTTPEIGLCSGGTNGIDGAVYDATNIFHFGYGIETLANNYHFMLQNSTIRDNGQNIHILGPANNSGESLGFTNDFIVDGANSNAVECFYIDNFGAATVNITGGSIDDCQLHIGTQILSTTMTGVHMENAGQATWGKYTPITINDSAYSSLVMNGGEMMNDATTNTPDQYILSNGATVVLNGVNFFNNGGSVVPNAIVGGHAVWTGLNNTNGGITNVITVSPIVYPFTPNGATKNDITNLGILGIASSSPFGLLSINPIAGNSVAFVIGSSTQKLFQINTTSTTTAQYGFNITTGCYAIGGTCVSGGGGGGSQTPWTSNIEGSGFNLNDAGVVTATNFIATSTATSTIANLGGILDVSQCSGANIGAQFNTCYGLLPATGGTVNFPRGNFSFNTEMVAATNNKHVAIECDPGGGTQLTWTSTTGTSTLINTGQNTFGQSSSINNCVFIGAGTTTPNVAVELGGSNGARGFAMNNVEINNFGNSGAVQTNTNTYLLTFTRDEVHKNGKAFYDMTTSNAGEAVNFYDGMWGDCQSSVPCVDFANGADTVLFNGTSLDDSQVNIGGSTRTVTFIGNNIESSGGDLNPTYVPIVIANSAFTSVNMTGVTFLQGANVNCPAQSIKNGAFLTISSMTVDQYGGCVVADVVTNTGNGWTKVFSVNKKNSAYTTVWNSTSGTGTLQYDMEDNGLLGINTIPGSRGQLEVHQTADTSSNGIALTNNAVSTSLRMWVDGTGFGRIDGLSGGTGSVLLNGAGAGFFGIGTTSPFASLSVQGSAGVPSLAVGSSTGTELIVDKGGNVGIGTSTPAARLHVQTSGGAGIWAESTIAPGAGSGAGIASFTSLLPTAIDQRLGFLSFGTDNNGTAINAALITGMSSQAWTAGSAQGSYLTFNTTPSGTATRAEAMRIDQNGNIGMGTTTPYADVSIQSNVSTGDAFVVATSSANAIFGIDNDGHRFTSGPAPAISTCGTGTGTVVGDDQSGTITTATAATACTMTFSKAYRNTPTCTVTDNSLVGFADVASVSTSAVTFGISSALTGGNLFYSCSYHK